jgi:HlyD family secretion protein
VAEAEAALQSAQAELATTELHAPFGGTVTAVNVSEGEMVLPGEVVLILADLDSLRAETTDLSERDVARVEIGQPATVLVEPLQTEVPGKVARIAPQASVIGGDVVYTVVVALDTQPEGLRWGMSADVEIQTEPAVTP